jgi:hypothetical protein
VELEQGMKYLLAKKEAVLLYEKISIFYVLFNRQVCKSSLGGGNEMMPPYRN